MSARSGALFCLLFALVPPAPAIELGAGGLNVRVPLTTMQQIRHTTTTRQQYDFSCGSAAIATLLTHHYGRRVTEEAVFEQMFRNGNKAKIRTHGFSLLDMQRYLATRGFRADGFELPLEKLFEAKLPAIVLISDNGYNHFVVIKGMADRRILLGDPSRGTRVMPMESFRAIWQNKLLFVIHSYKGMPAFNASADWRSAPVARLDDAINRNSLDLATQSRYGPGEF